MPTPQPRWAPARRVSVPPFKSITGARPGLAAPLLGKRGSSALFTRAPSASGPRPQPAAPTDRCPTPAADLAMVPSPLPRGVASSWVMRWSAPRTARTVAGGQGRVQPPGRWKSLGPTLRSSSIITAALAVVGFLAVSGLIALFDAAALLVVGLLAVSSAPVLRRILPRSPQLPRPGQQPSPPRAAPPSRLSSQPPPAQNRPRYPHRPDHGHRRATHSVTPSCAGGGGGAPASPPCSTPCLPGERLRLITTRSELPHYFPGWSRRCAPSPRGNN